MKSLKDYVNESYLNESAWGADDYKDFVFEDEGSEEAVKEFIMSNYVMPPYKTFIMDDCEITFDKTTNKYIVNCDDNVAVSRDARRGMSQLTNGMFKWGTIKGDFDCQDCTKLTSLEGAPEYVSGEFSCRSCEKLFSLEGAPSKVGGGFYCSNCYNLASLEGAPEKVGGDFWCTWCKKILNLEGAPKYVGRNFWCSDCTSLKSLKGAPSKIEDDFYCPGCRIKNLEGAPTIVKGDFVCFENPELESLEGAPKNVGGDFRCAECPKLKSTKGIGRVRGEISVRVPEWDGAPDTILDMR